MIIDAFFPPKRWNSCAMCPEKMCFTTFRKDNPLHNSCTVLRVLDVAISQENTRCKHVCVTKALCSCCFCYSIGIGQISILVFHSVQPLIEGYIETTDTI